MKTLLLTSSTHAFAYSTYGTQAAFGLVIIIGGVSIQPLSALLFLPVVGVVLFFAGLAGLYAITITHRDPNPAPGLRIEARAAWGVLAMNLVFAASLVAAYGLGRGVATLIYVLGIAVACGFRLWQIRRDCKNLKAALEHPRQADDATLAEPPTTEH